MKLTCLKSLPAVIVALLPFSANADTLPEWASSYSADDTCYCAPDVHPSLRNKIVATPVGGQSIAQVCQRIGTGPGLTLTNGEFNYPVFHDAQCGNGPGGLDHDDCEGRMRLDDSVCTGAGPAWDLKAAYARPAPPKTEPETKSTADPKPTAGDTDSDSAGIKFDSEDRVEDAAAEAAVARRLATEARQRALAESSKRPVENSDLASPQDLPVAETTTQVRQTEQVLEQEIAQQSSINNEALPDAETASIVAPVDAYGANPNLPELIELEPVSDTVTETADVGTFTGEAEAVQQSLPASSSSLPEVKTTEPEQVAQDNVDEKAPIALADAIAIDKVEQAADPAVIESGAASAVRLPSYASLSRETTGYIEPAPVYFDFGGGGASLAGALQVGSSWGLTAQAAVAQEYSEVMAGVRKSFLPRLLNGAEIQVLAGIEHGRIDREDGTPLGETGLIVGGAVGLNIGTKANLIGGINYSSFFEGDPSVFGHFLYRFITNLDFSSRVEGGDNANLRIGLRYHY